VKKRGLFQPTMPRGVANGRVLLLITTLLVTFGTIAVASASEGQSTANGGSAWSIMIHDLVYLGFGIFALYLASRVRLDRLVRAAPVLIIFGLGLLVAVRAIGVTSNGGKRWLNLHVIYLQPSELFKLFTVLFIAWLVQYHHDELGHWRQLAVWTLPVTLGCALIVIEPDIGTSSVVAVIAVAMLCVGGLSRKMLGRVAYSVSLFSGPTWRTSRTRPDGCCRSCTRTPISSGVAISCCRVGSDWAPAVSRASASATAVRSGDSYPIRTPTSSSPSSARNSASSAPCW